MIKNEQGKRYGRLLVLGRCERPTTYRAYWLCRCECGVEKPILGDHLRSGAIKACGAHGPKAEAWHAVARPNHGKRRPEPISTKALEISGGHGEGQFIRPHVYRTPRRIEMGPIVAAALAALEARS